MSDRPKTDWNQNPKHQARKFYDNGAVVHDAVQALTNLSRFRIPEGKEKQGVAMLHATMLTAANALAPVLGMLNDEHRYWDGKECSEEFD